MGQPPAFVWHRWDASLDPAISMAMVSYVQKSGHLEKFAILKIDPTPKHTQSKLGRFQPVPHKNGSFREISITSHELTRSERVYQNRCITLTG